MNKKFLLLKKLFIPLFIIATASGIFITNNPIKNSISNTFFTQQYLIIADSNGNIPTDVAVCNVDLSNLHSSTQTGIANLAKEVCMGGLITVGGPPILGNSAGFPLLNIYTKFNNDLQGAVVNNVLICQIPCTNTYAKELQTCHDFTSRPAPQSFSIAAYNTC